MRKFASLNILLFLFVHLFVCQKATAQAVLLSPQAQVVLFTCDRGEDLYAAFGHSAIMVYDQPNGIDVLYNFGTFDFYTPHFYLKFIRGKLDYMVSSTRVRNFLGEYNARKISVFGQTLNLTLAEKQRLFDYLQHKNTPENRFYKYDFFYDNCATRLRDLLEYATENRVEFHIPDSQTSLRKLLFPYLEYSPWIKLGINMVIASPSDKIATPYQYMYLPDHLKFAFQTATIETDSTKRNLVLEQSDYFVHNHQYKTNYFTHPVTIFGLLAMFVIWLTYFEIKRGRRFFWVDYTLFSIASLVSLFLIFMWFGTDHKVMMYNFNLLWVSPLHIFTLFFIRKKNTLYLVLYKWMMLYMIAIALILFLLPQYNELSFSLISLMIAARYMRLYLYRF